MSTSRPLLTQREAAAACGVSRSTIRRRREAGDLPGAVLDDQRGWLVPVEDLIAAGFRLHAPAAPEPSSATAGKGSGQDQDQVAALRAELAQVQHELALAWAETRHLTARLDERGQHIEDLQRALAALTRAPDRAALAPPEHLPPHPAVPAPARPVADRPNADRDRDQGQAQGGRRRWWSRRG